MRYMQDICRYKYMYTRIYMCKEEADADHHHPLTFYPLLSSPPVLQQTPEEELCNLLTNIIFSVLWSRSGLEGAEDVVWRERGQVFSVLTKLGSSCQLVRPPDDIKRRSVTEEVHISAGWWFSVTDRCNVFNYPTVGK